MTDKICFIITTMLRDDLLYKSAESLLPYIYQNPNWCMVIVDQGNLSSKKEEWLDKNNIDSLNYSRKSDQQQLFYYQVPFDSGLSYCRNYGVKKAKELDCKYVYIGSDSFIFNPNIVNLNKMMDNELYGYDIIGNELYPSKCGWEAKLNLIEGKNFELDFIDKSTHEIIYPVEICRNCFIAKTDILLNTPWDDNLKLCFDENTPILIKNGYGRLTFQPIKNLMPKSVVLQNSYCHKNNKIYVWTPNGWKKILKIAKKQTNEQMYTLHTSHGVITLTENHSLIINNKEIKAKDLKIGDKIEIGFYPKLSNKLNIDKKWAWLLGFFLAEGTCLSGKKKQNRIEFTNQNKNLLKKCEKTLNSLGIECKWYSNSNRKDKCHFLRIYCPGLLQKYFDTFYSNNEKIIPYFVYDFNKQSRIEFIKGFFDGDGTKFPKKPIILNQKSPSIINGLIWISSDLYKNYHVLHHSNKYGNWFTLNLKESKNSIKENTIININIFDSKKEVYDLECEEHTFCAGIGNIHVHNCEHEDEFYRLKLAGVKCAWTDSICLTKQTDRPDEYAKLRKTNFDNGTKYLRNKWNIKGWVSYQNLDRAKNYYKGEQNE